MAPTNVKKNQGLAVLVIALVLGIVLIIFFALPKWSDLNQENEAYAKAQTDLQQVATDKSSVLNSIQDLNNYNVDNLKLAIPDQADIPHLYAHLEALAGSAALHVTSIQGNDDTKRASGTGSQSGTSLTAAPDGTGNTNGPILIKPLPADIGLASIRIEVVGQYDAINQFLGAIKSSLRLMDVDEVALSANENGSAITAQVTLRAYYLK